MDKRALVYARVSYDDRKNESRNLQGQVEDGQGHCQERGYRIIAELAEDDRGASGASWDLPMLNQALDMARAGEFDVLVVRELDRFARGLAKQLVIEGEFKRHGVGVEYVLAQYDDTPEGRLNKHIRATIAEFEREKINQRTTRGRRRAAKNGKVMLHGIKAPPYGYRLEDEALAIYEPEAKIVRLIFTWYVYGDEKGKRLGIRTIVRRLTEMKIPTWADIHGGCKKAERGEWNTATIAGMLKNETFAGVWHYGKFNGDTGKANPRESWIPIETPAIVSPELWNKAQERLEHNKAMARRNSKYEYLVGRRVICGECNSKMVGCSKHARGKRYLYYTCRGYKLARKCTMTDYFRADQVDNAIWEWVKSWLASPEALRHGLKEQQAEQEQANKPLRDRLAMIDDLLSDNRRQLERLLDLYLVGDFTKEVLTERKTRLETTITALEQERADLVMTLESQTLTDDQIATIESFAREVSESLEIADQDFEARRQIIDLLDVTVTLAIEEGQKVAYVRCLVDETALPIESIIP